MKIFETPESAIEVLQIPQLISTKQQQRTPNYVHQLVKTIQGQASVKLRIISLIRNVPLHTALSYWVKFRAKVHRMQPFRGKENGRENNSRVVVEVNKTEYEFLRSNPQQSLMHKACAFPIDEP